MGHRITFKESLFLLPVLILLGIFSVYSICQTAIYSFFDYQLSDPVKNGMYLSSQFNAGLFEEGLKYIRFYIGDDAALAPDDASAEGFAELDRLCGEGFALLAELDIPEDEAKCKLSNAHLAALRTLQAEIASARGCLPRLPLCADRHRGRGRDHEPLRVLHQLVRRADRPLRVLGQAHQPDPPQRDLGPAE